ncbi:MAG: hypothetical protein P8010_16420 [Desulfosarcinaceae bacterium]
MTTTLHLLRSEPDDIMAALIEALIEALTRDSAATVCPLYPDAITQAPVDWDRLVDDIFKHDRVICWW